MITSTASGFPRLQYSGFTLIESMVILAIVAVLVSLAVPSFRDAMLNVRMTGQANDLMTDLSLARSEAAKRALRVALCTSNNGTACTNTAWDQGWIVFVDTGAAPNGMRDAGETLLKAADAFEAGGTMTVTGASNGGGGAPYVVYRPSGVSTPGGGNVVFTLCDSRTTASVGAAAAANAGRRLTINSTGRPSVARYTC